jgi:hypothetical protein
MEFTSVDFSRYCETTERILCQETAIARVWGAKVGREPPNRALGRCEDLHRCLETSTRWNNAEPRNGPAGQETSLPWITVAVTLSLSHEPF